MAKYFDSSILLANVFHQSGWEHLDLLWDTEPIRVASILVEAECIIAFRRAIMAQTDLNKTTFINEGLAALDEFFCALTLKDVDSSILEIIRQNPKLANCRCLDALHLATALYFQQHLEEPLMICTLDSRMRETATLSGFKVLPER